VSGCCLTLIQQFYSYIMARTGKFQRDDNKVHFVLDQHAELDFDVMVSMLALSAVDHEIELWSGQTKDYKIGICCLSAKHAALRIKSKD
jgi:hypothetical protein